MTKYFNKCQWNKKKTELKCVFSSGVQEAGSTQGCVLTGGEKAVGLLLIFFFFNLGVISVQDLKLIP